MGYSNFACAEKLGGTDSKLLVNTKFLVLLNGKSLIQNIYLQIEENLDDKKFIIIHLVLFSLKSKKTFMILIIN